LNTLCDLQRSKWTRSREFEKKGAGETATSVAKRLLQGNCKKIEKFEELKKDEKSHPEISKLAGKKGGNLREKSLRGLGRMGRNTLRRKKRKN